MVAINARAPLAELSDFQTRLKSITGGQGSYTLEMDDYETAPPTVQQQLVAAFRPREED
jgi:elongation factor G